MKKIMVDIESLGQQPGGVIISIGWAEFSEHGVNDKSYEISFDITTQEYQHLDEDVIWFWLNQPNKPCRPDTERYHIREGLEIFNESVAGCQLWAKPASYDIAAIRYAMRTLSIQPSWNFRNEICLRTILKVMPVEISRDESSVHTAVDDAIHQAKVASLAIANIRDKIGVRI